MNRRKKLPIGIQTFQHIREEGYYYVDKTPFVARLLEEGKYYFLSRPRRFGKSLFLDTLACAFEGRRELFDGLYLAEHWDWSSKHPVIRISFGSGVLETRAALDERIHELLDENQQRLGVRCTHTSISGCFGELIRAAAEKYGRRAVVLVDEYDKPILDNLHRPEVATQMRDGLRNFYSVIKDSDAFLQFAFLTGVSKFSKVSIFSGLNNLTDITLSATYATICGYTEADLDAVFAPELEGLEREEIRHWYNGYQWLGASVYNPFDLLLLFRERQFRNYWFETGTPTFLVNWLRERGFYTPQLQRSLADEALLASFDVEAIEPEALLWQTGYLTIQQQQHTPAGPIYLLGLPNHEVRTALNRALLRAYLPASPMQRDALALYDWLAQGDTAALRAHFERLYASIPHDWYRNNAIAQYEGYYASVFYSHLAALGLDLIAEDVSQYGQCDLTVRHAGMTYLFEFKLIDGDEATGAALAQLKSRNYAAKYPPPKIEIGIEFSRTRRQIVGWLVD